VSFPRQGTGESKERPHATFVSKLEITDGLARAKREVDAGLESIEVELPAVITVDLREGAGRARLSAGEAGACRTLRSHLRCSRFVSRII
jgi:electron transfer flavoprotein alpha/beta subunit